MANLKLPSFVSMHRESSSLVLDSRVCSRARENKGFLTPTKYGAKAARRAM